MEGQLIGEEGQTTCERKNDAQSHLQLKKRPVKQLDAPLQPARCEIETAANVACELGGHTAPARVQPFRGKLIKVEF